MSRSTDFKINDLSLVTSTGKKILLNGIYQEINIYESLLTPCVTGNITITDAIGLSKDLKFDGSEKLLIDIENSATNVTKIQRGMNRAFRIYKQSDIKSLSNQTSESYVLHFASEEFILSESQTLCECYKGTYTESALNILESKLKVSKNNRVSGTFDKSLGLMDVIIPNLKPFDALTWFSKRALDSQGLPTFMFFENVYGYNFTTISSIMKSEPIFTANYSTKNISNDDESNNMEYKGIRVLEIMTKFDFSKNMQSGLYSGTIVGINPLTRQFNITYPTPLSSIKDGKTQDNGSRVVYNISTEQLKASDWIKKKDPNSIQTEEVPQKYAFARKAILQSFVNQRIKVSLPGNFLVSPGRTLYLAIGTQSAKVEGSKDEVDKTLSGTYAVLSSRHIVKPNMCESIVELVTGFKAPALSAPKPITKKGVVTPPKTTVTVDDFSGNIVDLSLG